MTIFRLIRKCLPASLEARLGNRHKVKRHTLDKLFFRFTHHPGEERLYHRHEAVGSLPAEALEGNPCIAPELKGPYQRWYAKANTQQVVRVTGGVWIEPRTAWPMGPSNQLYLSLNPSGISPYMPVPPYRSIWLRAPVEKRERIICLRDINEAGYSHFYTDILAKLVLIKRLGIPLKDYTLVLSHKVANTAYAKFLLENAPIFREAGEILLQNEQFVQAEEALFASTFVNPSLDPELCKGVIAEARAACPDLNTATSTTPRKIYLTRASHRRRALRNDAEIAAIANARGFETVDADLLTLPQQMALFANCTHIVGIHGAGLVNILFRYPEKLALMEIREPLRSHLPPYAGYHNTCVALGYGYGATLGSDFETQKQSFTIHPERFRADFNRFCEHYGT